jgi:hypothetical protein
VPTLGKLFNRLHRIFFKTTAPSKESAQDAIDSIQDLKLQITPQKQLDNEKFILPSIEKLEANPIPDVSLYLENDKFRERAKIFLHDLSQLDGNNVQVTEKTRMLYKRFFADVVGLGLLKKDYEADAENSVLEAAHIVGKKYIIDWFKLFESINLNAIPSKGELSSIFTPLDLQHGYFMGLAKEEAEKQQTQ